MDNRPIGVFDSGLGGLSVVSALHKALPCENILYFGDTGRVPYGTRSKETIELYARQIENFLIQKDVKMVIAACGTVSSVAPHTGAELNVPFLGVVEPAANAAIKATKTKRIGVIGTTATIRSNAYEKAIKKVDSSIEVFSVDCPLFVPIVEAGWINDDEIAYLTAKRYLTPLIEQQVDTLILGCTHYPLISKTISRVMGEEVTLISSGKATALEAVELLKQNDLLSEKCESYHRFYVSDRPEGFMKTAQMFIKDDIFDCVEQYILG